MKLPIFSKLPRFQRVILISISFILGTAFLCWAGYQIIERPKYINLSIPAAGSYLPRGHWFFTQYSTTIYTDSGSRFFMVRMEDLIFKKAPDEQRGFETLEFFFEYFNSYLTNMNWQLYPDVGDNPCFVYLAESKFLPRGKNGYFTYRRPNTRGFVAAPTVCLAIWEEKSNYKDMFHVVLVTSNPSTFSRLKSEIDVPIFNENGS